MIEAETETAESPIKKAGQMVLTMGSTSRPARVESGAPKPSIFKCPANLPISPE